MNDEDIIRKRLLVDGDGTGDDRRINILLKKFLKWYNSDESVDKKSSTLDQLLSQVSQCEYAYTKSRLTAQMASSELNYYENISKQIENTIQSVKEEIVGTKEDFKEAKVIRKNRLEYEVLSKVINEQPDRKETNEKLGKLKKELENLEEKYTQLEEKLEMRRKQFHVLFSSLHQLQALLDVDKQDTKDIIDISLEGFDDDDDDIQILTNKCDVELMSTD
uniref:Putative tho complex n=1 Tax=Panstrongylus lignarius TaxID=156445 RepID=A0A224XSC6_9HEMI